MISDIEIFLTNMVSLHFLQVRPGWISLAGFIHAHCAELSTSGGASVEVTSVV